MAYDFRGKVALVTGAGGRRGIGRATALRLARDGADVALLDVAWPPDQKPSDEQAGWKGLASVAAEVEALGRKALTIEADISNERQVQAAVERTLARFGGVDIFVANAGARPAGDRVPVLDLPEEELRRVLSVNVVGTFLCCKAVGRRMVDRGKGGSIVVVSSEAGRMGRPRMAAYSASKFALIGLTQAFALEMAPHQVRVNAVCPGTVDTARLDWTARTRLGDSGLSADEMRARMLETRGREIPLGRVATAGDVASVIAFLCTPEVDAGPTVTYCTYPIRGGEFDPLWRAVEGRSVAEIKAKEGEELPLFKLIRQHGMRRETPLIVETLRAFAEGRARIAGRQVVDGAGRPATGHDLTAFVERTLARV